MSAAEWLSTASVPELAWVMREYGLSRAPRVAERVAESVIQYQRKHGPFTSMAELNKVCGRACGNLEDLAVGKDTFSMVAIKSIRMFLNHELDQLRLCLQGAFQVLVPRARCVIITFKMSECDIVQDFIASHHDPPRGLELTVSQTRLLELYPLVGTDLDFAVERLKDRGRRPEPTEVNANYRSKSSTVHTVVKVPRVSQRVTGEPRDVRDRFKRPEPPPFMASPLVVKDIDFHV